MRDTFMASPKDIPDGKNILTAFCGESQAQSRYTFFAGFAKKNGYVRTSDIFTEISSQEKEQAEWLFKLNAGRFLYDMDGERIQRKGK
jgi:rubrerythrin